MREYRGVSGATQCVLELHTSRCGMVGIIVVGVTCRQIIIVGAHTTTTPELLLLHCCPPSAIIVVVAIVMVFIVASSQWLLLCRGGGGGCRRCLQLVVVIGMQDLQWPQWQRQWLRCPCGVAASVVVW